MNAGNHTMLTMAFSRGRFPGLAALAALMLAAFGDTATAQLYWTGSAGSNWNSTSWSTDISNPGTQSTPTNGSAFEFRNTFPTPTTKSMNNDFSSLSVGQVSGFSLNFNGGTGYVLGGNAVTLTGDVRSTGGSNTLNLPIVINDADFEISAGNGGTFIIDGVISETGGARGLRIGNNVNTGSANTTLSGANSYSGNTVLGYFGSQSQTVTINTLANSGTNQSLGKGTAIQFGFRGNGNVIYTGSATSTNKTWSLGESSASSAGAGGSFANNGSGAVVWTGSQTQVFGNATARQFTLGGTNTDNNTWQSAIQNNHTSGTNGLSPVSLQKTGAGKWILSGTNTYTGATTVSAGQLAVDGSIATSSGVSVSSGATLGGSGRVSAISGAGTVAPGNSPGILRATAANISTGMDFKFEFTQAGAPTWSSATASGNDVLRLTDATTPISSTATAANVFDIYFPTITAETTFLGGLFTDRNASFESLISAATYNYYTRDPSGPVSYGGFQYSALASADVTRTTVQVASANFSGGTVTNGYTMQFVVVPEPAGIALAGIGVAAAALGRRLCRRERPTAAARS